MHGIVGFRWSHVFKRKQNGKKGSHQIKRANSSDKQTSRGEKYVKRKKQIKIVWGKQAREQCLYISIIDGNWEWVLECVRYSQEAIPKIIINNLIHFWFFFVKIKQFETVELINLNPCLKSDEFCREMSTLYVDNIDKYDDIAKCYAATAAAAVVDQPSVKCCTMCLTFT